MVTPRASAIPVVASEASLLPHATSIRVARSAIAIFAKNLITIEKMIPKHKIKKNPRDYIASKSRNIVVAWKVAENRGFSEDYIVWREKMGVL